MTVVERVSVRYQDSDSPFQIIFIISRLAIQGLMIINYQPPCFNKLRKTYYVSRFVVWHLFVSGRSNDLVVFNNALKLQQSKT